MEKIKKDLWSANNEIYERDEELYQAQEKVKLLEQVIREKSKLEEELKQKVANIEEENKKFKASLGDMVMKSQLQFVKEAKEDVEKKLQAMLMQKQ